MGIRFTWDRGKAKLNFGKHGINFDEAVSVFRDRMAFIFDDEDHSDQEYREIIIGQSHQNRLLIVIFTERDDTVRIISARKANQGEVQNMKKRNDEEIKVEVEGRDHYEFDYSKAKPNRFAEKLGDTIVITLEPDVASAFPTPEAVNEALRLVMKLSAIPAAKSPG